MGLLATLQKQIKAHHVIFIIGVIIAVFALYQYNQDKGLMRDGMKSKDDEEQKMQQFYALSEGEGGAHAAASPALLEGGEQMASVEGGAAAQGLPSCSAHTVTNPADLLPKDANSEWAKLNPRASGDLENVNLLRPGYWKGVDTVGSSLRNANLQIRSEPPNPVNAVSPWNNTTITPDLMRVPLEIGGACGQH